MLDLLEQSFNQVKVTNSIFSNEDKQILSAYTREYMSIIDDARMVLKEHSLFAGQVTNERERVTESSRADSRKLIDISAIESTIKEFIGNKFSAFLVDFNSYMVKTYRLERYAVSNANSVIEEIDYLEYGRNLLSSLGVENFSIAGFNHFKSEMKPILFKSSLSKSRLSLNRVPISFNYNGEFDRMNEYSNKSYMMVLKALSLLESKTNPSDFNTDSVAINDNYFNVLPRHEERPKQSFLSKFEFEEHSNIIESFRFYQNDRMDIKFKSEDLALRFYGMFS